MVLLQQTNINSTDVSTKVIRWTVNQDYGDCIDNVSITLRRNVNDLLTLEAGQTIDIYRGWSSATDEKIFDGYIESIEVDGGLVIVKGKNKMWDLVRRTVNYNYDSEVDASAGKISDIWTDLVETYGGLDATGTVQDSGTTHIIEKFKCNRVNIFERCKKLADTIQWQQYYKASDDKVYFEPRGYTDSGQTLTVGTEIIGIPVWRTDNSELYNDVYIRGGQQEIETTESGQIGVTAGFTTSAITLTHEPNSVKVYSDSSNPPTTLLTGGVIDSTASYDYTVDKRNKKILGTFVTNEYAEVRYSYFQPIVVHLFDDDSVASYQSTTKVLELNDIVTVHDGEARATELLADHATPAVFTTIKIKNNSALTLRAGQKIRVVDTVSVPNVDKTMVIKSYRIRYPGDYDELDVGDKEWQLAEWQSGVEERLKRLMEEQAAAQDITQEIVQPKLNEEYLHNRYVQIRTQESTGDVMIWGDANYSTWGTDKWGTAANAFTAEADSFIRQGDNYYKEDFDDDDFESTNTTADWDTTNEWVDFTSGEIAESSSIDYNNGTITTAKLTPTVSNGSFTYEMTSDGTNWEEITVPIAHYKLNDNLATTNVIDNMGNYDGTASFNTADNSVTGKINNALEFDVDNEPILINLGAFTGDFTYSAWLNIASYSAYSASNGNNGLIGDKDNYTEGRISFQKTVSNKISVWTADGDNTITLTESMPTNTWYHFTITRDGSNNIKIYKDGVDVTSGSPTAIGTINFEVLADNPGDSSWKGFNGKMDDVRVYNKALSTDEIAQVYNSGSGTEDKTFAHTFTDTGTDLRFRATENATSTGRISQIKIESYH